MLTGACADLLSFLDRSNIGNAKVEGIERDIRITNYPLVVTMFFVVCPAAALRSPRCAADAGLPSQGYVIFEIPANLVLKVVSARSPAVRAVWRLKHAIR